MFKRYLLNVSGLFLMVLLVLSGCSNESAIISDNSSNNEVLHPKNNLKVGMSFQEMNNPYFVSMREAFEEAVKSLGGEILTTDAQHDVSKQINDIDDMIQQGIDILLINPADSEGAEAAVQAAHDAGIITVAVDAQAEGPLDSFVGSKNYDAGYLAGKQMAEDLQGKGKVAILDGIPVVPILERIQGFEDAIKEYPNIEIVDKQNGRQDRAEAMSVTENMLQANPDLDAIFSVNDEGALGSLGAIEASDSNVWIYSVDGHPEAIEAILSEGPFKATSAQYPADQVRVALGIALAKYWGAEVIPDEVPIEVKLLTIENAADFSW